MTKTQDKLLRELETFDPVSPRELEDAREGAAALLEMVMRVEPDQGAEGRGGTTARGSRLRSIPVFVALTAVAIALLVILVGMPGGGERVEDEVDVALGQAASAAVAQSTPVANLPYTYLETRQLATETGSAGGRSVAVVRRTTRQEWVGWDGSGRLRTVTALPGSGTEPRSEDRWIETGLLDDGVEELPIGPAPLAARLREEARGERGGIPLPAAILDLIATDLRSPVASPALRQALYRAAALTPGIEYLGPTVDPEGRRGVAVGVTGPYRGVPARYSLIFDPRTSRVLATEATALDPDGDEGAPGRPLIATIYLDSRGAASPSPHAETWLADYQPSSAEAPPTSPFLVYRIPESSQWANELHTAANSKRRMG